MGKKTKMDDQHIEERIAKMIRIYRIVGWALMFIGGCALAFSIVWSFGSDVRGQQSLGSKLGSVAFVAVLPIIGIIFAFNSKEKIASSLRRVMTMGRR